MTNELHHPQSPNTDFPSDPQPDASQSTAVLRVEALAAELGARLRRTKAASADARRHRELLKRCFDRLHQPEGSPERVEQDGRLLFELEKALEDAIRALDGVAIRAFFELVSLRLHLAIRLRAAGARRDIGGSGQRAIDFVARREQRIEAFIAVLRHRDQGSDNAQQRGYGADLLPGSQSRELVLSYRLKKKKNS